MSKEIPEVAAYDVGNNIHWIAWCGFCCRWHWHGQGAGPRVAHCLARQKPYYQYRLKYAGQATPGMVKDARRRRPQGPPWCF